MKKVLILTASFGDGHNAAARNLRDALEQADPTVEVEVVDLLQSVYGRVNQLARAAYLRLVRHAPAAWRAIYQLLEKAPHLTGSGSWSRLGEALASILEEQGPDCVISTYPLYGELLRPVHRAHGESPFRLLTVITDSISIHGAWCRAPSGVYCVANEESAEILGEAGVPRSRIAVTGFPVASSLDSPHCRDASATPPNGRRRLLFVVSPGARKIGGTLERLLKLEGVDLTVTTGRDAALRSRLEARFKRHDGRLRILGWTNLMPRLLATHDLVITKAGGATVQEAIAARCPLIINHTIPGQEEGNARLVLERGYGTVTRDRDDTLEAVRDAFASGAQLWRTWRANLGRDHRPGAALRIARLALEEDDRALPPAPSATPTTAGEASPASPHSSSGPHLASPRRSLLCDLHIHTNYSDGRLTVPEVVDFYGAHGFDCICITDHLADPRRLIGKVVRLSRLTLCPTQLEEYFEVIRREAARAWRRYGMIVLAGIEFNKDGYTPKTSAHLLGVGLEHPIRPDLDIPETIARIHAQDGLAIASHPHLLKSEWGKNTLYLWENQETYIPLLDAWEIANRDNLFAPIARKRLPFVANSDFHKPRHIYSWKTVLNCEKDPAAIKACIRRNEQVSITMYRRQDAQPRPEDLLRPRFSPSNLPAPALNLESPDLVAS